MLMYVGMVGSALQPSAETQPINKPLIGWMSCGRAGSDLSEVRCRAGNQPGLEVML